MADTGLLGRLSELVLEVWGRQLDKLISAGRPSVEGNQEVEALYLRARSLVRVGRPHEAIPLFERAKTLAPSFEDALEGYGEALDMAGRSHLATSMYESHRRLRFGMRRSAPDRSFALRRVSRFTAEVADYSWLLRSGRNQAFPYIARGNAHLALGRPERAVVDYISALGCDPTRLEAITLKGEALSLMGRYQDARAAFDTVLAQRPDDTEALSGRAIVHLACDRMAVANVDWRRQLALLPADRSSARACVALRLADYATARLELDRALEREPNELYWRLYRLTTAFRVGEPLLPGDLVGVEVWPGPLLELLAGRLSSERVLQLADCEERRAETYYQLGVLALRCDQDAARRHFQQVIDLGLPSLIEHAAARHELTRWCV